MTTHRNQEQTKNFLRNNEAASHIGVSLVTLWRLSENDPSFPRKIRITSRCVGFNRSELDAYLELKKSM